MTPKLHKDSQVRYLTCAENQMFSTEPSRPLFLFMDGTMIFYKKVFSARFIASVASVITVCVLISIYISNARSGLKGIVMQRGYLSNIFYFMSITDDLDDRPPIVVDEFTLWIENKFLPGANIGVDPSNSFKSSISQDYWGNTIKIIVLDGEIWAFASCGPNGIWEEGRGDDIIYYKYEYIESSRGKEGRIQL